MSGTKGGKVVHTPSRQREVWGTGVGRVGTGEEATEGTEVNFSVEQICVEFGLRDVSIDYSRETKAGTSSIKKFQEKYEAQIQAGNIGVPVSKLRMLVAAKWRQVNWEAQQEKMGVKKHGQRSSSSTPKKGTSRASPGIPPLPQEAGITAVDPKQQGRREDSEARDLASRPGWSRERPYREVDGPGSPTSCRPQHIQGQILGSPLGLGREAEIERFQDTAGSQEEEEVLGIYSPTWELEDKDRQDNQISDWEDIEAGDKDPLIIINEVRDIGRGARKRSPLALGRDRPGRNRDSRQKGGGKEESQEGEN